MKHTLLLTDLAFVAALCFSVPGHAQDAPHVPVSDLVVPDGLEVTLWAKSPLLLNPTNMDTDAEGRLWVAEGVNYRRSVSRPEGDRIVVIEDTDGDGKADASHTFVQDPELIAPLGVSVFDNKIVVAPPPHILVYTDVDRDLKFDPAVDKREEFLSGFNARNHDHSLHATVAGPDGMWYFNNGNCGAKITDKDGRVFQSGGPYYDSGAGTPEWFNDPTEYAGKPSADGNVYSAGFAGRIAPDGSGLQIVGHGFRNSYELCVNSFGDIFQNDNDDPPACRNTWLMEGGFLGFFSKDASWWMINRGLTEWAKYGTRELLKERGIYDPETIILQASTVPDAGESKLPSPQELVKMNGDAVAGKVQAMRCVMCHKIDDVGVEYGPDLKDWVANQGKIAFFDAVTNPSAGIAHGYEGYAVNLKDGTLIEGLVFSKLDPVVVVSTGGLE